MTADQVVRWLFEEHWLLTTVLFPQVTMVVAWATDSSWWFVGSFGLLVAKISVVVSTKERA